MSQPEKNGHADAPKDNRDRSDGLRQFPCASCGAPMRFLPGTRNLKCPYCGHENLIPEPPPADGAGKRVPTGNENGENGDDGHAAPSVEELDYENFLALAGAHEAVPGEEIEAHVVHCRGCGADITLPEDSAADFCPYCAQPVVAADAVKETIRVQAVLPFKIDHGRAEEAWRTWLSGLWFAPSRLDRLARRQGSFKGVYLPYWTYDSKTGSAYAGQRGDYYYVTVGYATRVNGQVRHRTRQERRTRWTPATGSVARDFDDVLVPASRVWPTEMLNQLEPWDLPSLEHYRPEFLSGFRAEKYQIGLKDGFVLARERMDRVIRADVARDIGGDEQRISSLRTKHREVTFKHVLLPLWVNGYRFRDRLYHCYINARTGEVAGDRPWSVWKITLAVLAGLAGVAGILAWMGVFSR